MTANGLHIREAAPADLDRVLAVERAAFGRDDEVALVAALLRDPTAQPSLSLLAFEGERAIGHVLFTHVALTGATPAETDCRCALLAPLAVVPDAQRRGVGRALIDAGCERLAAAGVALVFVLGDPAYYTGCGFGPAIPQGLHAPYPIDPEAAWQVRALGPGMLGSVRGTVACAASMAPAEYWRE